MLKNNDSLKPYRGAAVGNVVVDLLTRFSQARLTLPWCAYAILRCLA
jgi:hypothetical protein